MSETPRKMSIKDLHKRNNEKQQNKNQSNGPKRANPLFTLPEKPTTTANKRAKKNNTTPTQGQQNEGWGAMPCSSPNVVGIRVCALSSRLGRRGEKTWAWRMIKPFFSLVSFSSSSQSAHHTPLPSTFI
uniref:Uncharacterized protein n=1 Tax=Lotharella globosa TaxID=91324 RepID=A0A7S3YMG6_9EUKA|mmetsp:Transcript_11684/g.23489  ORF Transcript_11684/g.23489 Transcript_11684/m.23489 type:complete len:129 (-) Transcript_11684:613-999(-)